MFTTLSRIIKYGFQIFWRNSLVSLTAIVVMALALLVFHLLIISDLITKEIISTLYDKIDIAVYFKTNTSEDNILQVQDALKNLKEIKGVEYISQAKALDLFKDRHKEDPTITQAITELGENPLLASLNVRANDPEYYKDIAAYLGNDNLANLVEKVTYNQNRGAIDKLVNIVKTFRKLGLGLTIFLALTAALVTFNTFRLAIYSNREEIGIMRLVGSSNKFINGPYVVNGILYGIIAAAISFLVIVPIIFLVSPYLNVFIPELNLSAFFVSHILIFLSAQLIFGVFLGIVSSALAVRRYLKT